MLKDTSPSIAGISTVKPQNDTVLLEYTGGFLFGFEQKRVWRRISGPAFFQRVCHAVVTRVQSYQQKRFSLIWMNPVAAKACLPPAYPAVLAPQTLAAQQSPLDHTPQHAYSPSHVLSSGVECTRIAGSASAAPHTSCGCWVRQRVFNNSPVFRVLEQKHHNNAIQLKIKQFVKRRL